MLFTWYDSKLSTTDGLKSSRISSAFGALISLFASVKLCPSTKIFFTVVSLVFSSAKKTPYMYVTSFNANTDCCTTYDEIFCVKYCFESNTEKRKRQYQKFNESD